MYNTTVGNTHGYWEVTSEPVYVRKRKVANCKCKCGTESVVSVKDIVSGKSKSCGCLRKEHGLSPRNYCINSVMSTYRSRAKSKNLEFNITREEFSQCLFGNCHICGRSGGCFSNDRKKNHSESLRSQRGYPYTGVDRLDSKAGYITGNVKLVALFAIELNTQWV